MKTFHEWMAERTATKSEGLWLNDKLAVPGMSNVSPLNKLKGVKLKPPKPFRPTPPATLKPFSPIPPPNPKPMLRH